MDNTFAIGVDWEAECKERAKMCEELHVQCGELQQTNNELKATIEVLRSRLRYADGLADGLRFAIRCNGVSGAEVKEA